MEAPALAGRRVVLGVCGGIAAYKAVEVCRRLTDRGAAVSPVLTAAATRFVGALTFSALADEPARTSLWDADEPIPHTRLGQRADVIVVAPATARLIGSYAAGISSDLLTATLLATRAPVVLCPAMHTEMWEHPAVQDNLATLARRGVRIVAPAAGRLAGGDIGTGRLAEPETIVAAVEALLAEAPAGAPAAASGGVAGAASGGVPAAAPAGVRPTPPAPSEAPRGAGWLAGRRAVVTAGGTREPIDAVRYVGNRSSGKQGYAVAEVLAARGASVTLVSAAGLAPPAGVELVAVETAAQMEEAVQSRAADADVVVMAAAVADFRPARRVAHKLKKADGVPELVLEPTPDILAGLGQQRRPGQVLVGFAAETVTDVAAPAGDGPADGQIGGDARQRLIDYATGKLAGKGVDLIVANDVAAPSAGFGHDTNAVVIVGADGRVADIGLRPKLEVASALADAIEAYGERRAAAVSGHLSPTPTRAEDPT
ncbi:MAG TPA: bifunctional phosphopantothenoylcysteine decarboxylase/phosphopantothenate synthase [Acidimicrobiales bacterium]|nr:bifunctional phosphopantothenoylcysteine decarboxylase/phosphopantothenate synthase [Acidimicrobiales bacterium]